MLQPAFAQMGLEIGGSPSEEQEIRYLSCPYCGHRAQTSQTLTQTFHSYVQRYMHREIILPSINKMFSNLADSTKRHQRRSKGLISFTVKIEANEQPLPPRPISGPEPPDMMVVDLLCCNEPIKILDGWRDLIICPYCDIKLAIQ